MSSRQITVTKKMLAEYREIVHPWNEASQQRLSEGLQILEREEQRLAALAVDRLGDMLMDAWYEREAWICHRLSKKLRLIGWPEEGGAR
jgi:hypothetical protein